MNSCSAHMYRNRMGNAWTVLPKCSFLARVNPAIGVKSTLSSISTIVLLD
jgi:hypothetical protein